MFKSRDAAAQVQRDLLSVNVLLIYSLRRVEAECSEKEFKAYKQVVARLMGNDLIDTLAKIWKKHPDLMPENFKDASNPEQ